MKVAGILVSLILSVFLLFSCNNAGKKQDSADTKIATPPDSTKTMAENGIIIDTEYERPHPNERPYLLKAKFVDFTLGDASHFTFKDEAGKTWDFAGNDDSTAKFAVELPKNKANNTNQGWGSAKELQGKWFNITYVNRNQPAYQDGPIVNVPVILSAKKAD